MMMGKRVLSGCSGRPKCPRMGSYTISNPGGQSTQTSMTVSGCISAVKKVTIPFTWKAECLVKRWHILKKVIECDSVNSNIPGAVGINKYDLSTVSNPTNVTAVSQESIQCCFM